MDTTTTETYRITGMSCQGCANTIQRMVGKLDGVADVAVSYATESMTLKRGSAGAETVIKTVRDLGYDAIPAADKKKA